MQPPTRQFCTTFNHLSRIESDPHDATAIESDPSMNGRMEYVYIFFSRKMHASQNVAPSNQNRSKCSVEMNTLLCLICVSLDSPGIFAVVYYDLFIHLFIHSAHQPCCKKATDNFPYFRFKFIIIMHRRWVLEHLSPSHPMITFKIIIILFPLLFNTKFVRSAFFEYWNLRTVSQQNNSNLLRR